MKELTWISVNEFYCMSEPNIPFSSSDHQLLCQEFVDFVNFLPDVQINHGAAFPGADKNLQHLQESSLMAWIEQKSFPEFSHLK